MATWYPLYMLLWGAACLASLLLYLKERDAYAISHRMYREFLLAPWKAVTFLIAATCLTVMAPYTGDPTWDYYDSVGMSVLTFLTAPWVVGVLYRTATGRVPLRQGFVAVCVWMFTVSWSFDTYILIRDGEYTPLWLPNIFASSALYLSAGLLWNLDWKPERGTIFAFMEPDWPSAPTRPVFRKVAWLAFVLMGLVTLLLLPFLFDGHLDFAAWLDGW
jgi:hypothetical protein